MLSPGEVIADLPLGYARAIAAGGDDWRTTSRPYWLDRLRFLGGEASFAAARRLCHLLAVAASGPAWRSASTYESLDKSLPVYRRRGVCRSETLLASPVRRVCSSPCFPDMAAGSSNTSHEVWSPTALSGCVALSRGCQPFRDGPASTFAAPALVPARVVLAVFGADRGSVNGPSLRRSRIPRPGAGHASQVPCKRCSATR